MNSKPPLTVRRYQKRDVLPIQVGAVGDVDGESLEACIQLRRTGVISRRALGSEPAGQPEGKRANTSEFRIVFARSAEFGVTNHGALPNGVEHSAAAGDSPC